MCGCDTAGVDAHLRPWVADDAPALANAMRTSPDLAAQFPGGVPSTELDFVSYMAQHLVSGTAKHDLAIIVDGIAVGTVGLSNIEHVHQTGWAYYWLAKGARGRGLATRGLATIADLAFTELGLFRLELGHRTGNAASCRVASRAGFRPEGIERQKLRYGKQRFDVETHARLTLDPVPDIELIPRTAYLAGPRQPDLTRPDLGTV